MAESSDVAKTIAAIESTCRTAQEEIKTEGVKSSADRLRKAIASVRRAFSGSWLGYHANVYYEGFRAPEPGDHFSAEWGFLDMFSNPTSPNWREWPKTQSRRLF